MVLLMCSFVFAQNQNQVGSQNQEQLKEQNREQAREMIQSGLDNALKQMTNTKAKTQLKTNMERFEEKVQYKLYRLENIRITDVDEETGEVSIEAQENVKFLGLFQTKLNNQFKVNEQGMVTEQKRWYHSFFSG